MCHIPHTRRRNGRYVFRRRVHFRNLISKPIPLALQTADPAVARMRAAMLSARFVVVKASVEKMLETGWALTGAEIEALFRHELEAELTRNLHDAFENAPWSSSVAEAARTLAEAYRIARRPDRPRTLSDADREALRARGFAADIDQIDEYLREFCHEISDDDVRQRLVAVGAPHDEGVLETARTHLLRARATAWLKTTHVFDDEVMDAANPVAMLLEHEPEPATVAEPAPLVDRAGSNVDARECQFLIYDSRRFGDIIEDVLAELKAEGTWKGDLKQQRRIMETFRWITGDRALGSYNHLDVANFKQGLQRLPVSFRFGSSTAGAMSRPFAQVVAELPPLEAEQRRNLKTVNRDLSTMSTVAKHLAQTAWKSKIQGATVMDFRGATVAIKESDSTELRPPWTTAHLECLFRSPIYTGGGGAKRRLKQDEPHPHVWHDAAYFASLLWYYHHACREEICGLRVDEVVVDHVVPHFIIQDNDVRGRDGEKAGEKRAARRRTLPVHPELIRLGFLDYVSAIQHEGHPALFPELYQFAEKRGGAWFYDRAWRFMVEWIGDRMPIPTNDKGKGPDIHSIRGLGSSFYEVDGVNEIMRADIMGHARQGTNAKHYSKRIKTEGLAVWRSGFSSCCATCRSSPPISNLRRSGFYRSKSDHGWDQDGTGAFVATKAVTKRHRRHAPDYCLDTATTPLLA